MKYIVVLFFILFFTTYSSKAQTGCAIVYHYDRTGFLILREYYCGDLSNVGGKPAFGGSDTSIRLSSATELQAVTVLYPNPTTGKFAIRFGEELREATISITDLNGKIIMQQKASGFSFEFDLANYAAGAYFIRINNQGKIISQKVIKQ